jgi:hypothetical protein
MLRKKLAILAAAAMMTLTASSAFAAFADSHLIRVYYDRAGVEIATDLGLISSILAAPSTNVTGAFGTATNAVYFAFDRANNNLWASNSTTTAPLIIGGANGVINISSGTTTVYSNYNTQGGTNYSGLASAINSYKNKLSATQGWLGNTITGVTARAATELSLATLATNNTQTLYFWADAKAATTAGKTGVAVAQIITNADGSSTINAVATPIPAAIYLMGSGLLGLVGLRRRNKVA